MINIVKFHISSSKAALTHKPFTGTMERNQTHWTSHITNCFFHTTELSFLSINIILINLIKESTSSARMTKFFYSQNLINYEMLSYDMTWPVGFPGFMMTMAFGTTPLEYSWSYVLLNYAISTVQPFDSSK